MVRPTSPSMYVITDVSPAILAVDKKAYTFRFVYGFIKSDLNVLVSSTLPSSTLNHMQTGVPACSVYRKLVCVQTFPKILGFFLIGVTVP